MRFVASLTAFDVRPVGPPNAAFLSITATFAPSLAARMATDSPPGPEPWYSHSPHDNKKSIVSENHGAEKWQSMVDQVLDPEKMMLTYNTILPNFLNQAILDTTAH